MTDAEYVGTVVARCPACAKRLPGHVVRDPHAGVAGWTCPECGNTCDPLELEDDTRRVEVDA